MFTFISNLISSVKEFIRDRDNIENYLAWGLDYKKECLYCNYDRFDININEIKNW